MTSNQDIQRFLAYFRAAKMVNFNMINTEIDLEQARRFCSCLRDGILTEITTNTIWYSLCELEARGWFIPEDWCEAAT